jgi:hypothetical protein
MAARVALDDAVQVRILAPQFVTIPCKIPYFVRSGRYRAGVPRKRGYDEAQVREAVATSASLSQALKKLGLRPAGGNHRTLKKLIAQYGIATSHLDPNWSLRVQRRRTAIPLSEILTEGSDYHRGHLKRRLYEAGLKERKCELCGLGDNWRGGHMALILDHINGVANDNRLENLRVVCPNCAATLATHCGRKNKLDVEPRRCLHCGGEFSPKYQSHRYCSQICGTHSKGPRRPKPETRKVVRPSYEQLMRDVQAMSFLAIGRKYGVSDRAVRKWIRWYEQRSADEGQEAA